MNSQQQGRNAEELEPGRNHPSDNGSRTTTARKSQAQTIESRKLAGHKATGPRTPQGKQRSKFNAFKHGLFSKAVLLKNESRAEYESLLNGLWDDCQPRGKLETALVENLAILLWRKRRLLQVETAEISKKDFLTGNSLTALQVQELDYARPEGASVGQPGDSSNRVIVQEAINCLTKVQLALAADARGEAENSPTLRILFGQPQEGAKRDRGVRECMEVSRLVANFAKGKENTDNPDQLKKLTGEALGEEVQRLTSLYNHLVAREVARTRSNVAAARIPSQEVSDRLLRFEAHLSREFDRTMNQLERLQRTRLGQPVLPKLEVHHSLS